MDNLPIKRALLSVTDKSGLIDLAKFLVEREVELVSTGGTERALKEAGLPVTPVSAVTGFPEILNGRVKTLHPFIHGGILADKDNPEHLRTLQENSIKPFDCVVVNLYNFAAAAQEKADLRSLVEEIDIGGPCLLRASAKNFHSILVLPAVKYYSDAMRSMREHDNCVPLDFRKRMAVETFTLTSAYDRMISGGLAETSLYKAF